MDSPNTTSTSNGLGSEPEMIEGYEAEKPTASHALADESTEAPVEEKGASQFQHDEVEVKNLGWNEDARHVPQPVVGGLRNEELWTLIRRFNTQVFQVKSIQEVPLADLDMNIAEDDSFSPDKLRAQLERLYITTIVSLVSLWKHIVRLRSWREWERTFAFLVVYSLAWLLDLVVPTVFGFLMVLVLHTPSRHFCFPPVPPSIIDSKTGGVKKPSAGVLATDDTVTGAPEKHEGEGVEQEAHSFVNSMATVVISTTAGKHPQGDAYDDNTAPDPTQLAEDLSKARDKTDGEEATSEHDKTRKPISDAVWSKAGPAMHLISELVDTWERFGNALNPTPPFHTHRPRYILATCLLPMMLGSFFVSSYMAMKGLGFAVGFAFFGDPIITPTVGLLNRTYPRWQKFVEIRHTILRGVPTNTQLAITLLRIGERNKAPIPPPPSSDVPPAMETDPATAQQVKRLGVSDEEAREAVEPALDREEDNRENHQRKPKRSHRILNLLKGAAKGGLQTALTADKAKAAVGEPHAKNRLGVINSRNADYTAGPICFPARYHGKKGHVYITAAATTPAVSWTSDIEDLKPAWTVAIEEIEELKKVGGLGWKSKLMVGWAMEREVVDGLVIKTKEGKEHHLTAIVIRDELFNRLIAMGHQMWEAC
ncbi:hypothetical protein PT974_10865 [Cladobotryum mycophilum]|uniref:Uncharacterized protein n=1 Tax=Cladobotryum mycophilum TaxID=491253 RepID=A0ABR0SB04_9HYPO